MDRILLAHAQLVTDKCSTPWPTNKSHITGIMKTTTSNSAKGCQTGREGWGLPILLVQLKSSGTQELKYKLWLTGGKKIL